MKKHVWVGFDEDGEPCAVRATYESVYCDVDKNCSIVRYAAAPELLAPEAAAAAQSAQVGEMRREQIVDAESAAQYLWQFGGDLVLSIIEEVIEMREAAAEHRGYLRGQAEGAGWVSLMNVDVVGGETLPRPAAWSWAWVEPACDPEGWADLFEATALLRWNPHSDTWQGTSDCGDTIGLPHREVSRYAVVTPPQVEPEAG